MSVDIRKRIRDLRKTRGMSAKDVSEKMGISRPFYTQLEGGTRRLSVQYLEGVARALSTTVSDLYRDDAALTPARNPQLAEKLRPYLGSQSESVAENLKGFADARNSLWRSIKNGTNGHR
mgnify:FL=1